ncbi:MAG: VWA domain-containing protein [Mariniblastus sp.]|nr:VWA domain-containing protein [Mariniblastus sp.]
MNETFSILTHVNWLPSGFIRPWVLWLEVLPALLLAWIWLRTSRGLALPVDHSRHRSGRFTRILISLAESLAPLLLAIIVWISAGPLELGRPVARRQLTNILFCVDISGSMTASFGDGSRYDASMQAINQFLDYRQGDAFGLSFFGNSVLHWCPLTTDTSAVKCSPPFMRPEIVPPWFGGTEIGKALMECRKLLIEQEQGDRMIILVSDGASSDLAGGRSDEIAARMIADGITVYAIHIASSAVPAEIVKITTMTEGEVFEPGDPESLEAVFRRIDGMQKAEMERTVAEQLDHFRPYAAVGLILVVLMTLCSYGLRYTPW